MDVLDLFRFPLAALILLVPGLLVGWVLAPQASAWLQRVVWGLSASLAVLMVGGLLLNAAHALNTGGWWLLLVLLLGLAAGGYRLARKRGWVGAITLTPLAAQAATVAEGLGGRQAVMLLAALGIVIGAVSVARAGAEESLRAPSTELWAVAGEGKVAIGVHNREGQVMSYRIELTSGKKLLEAWDVPAMASGAVYEHTLPQSTGNREADSSHQVLLYRAGESTPYRHVSFDK